MESLFTLFYVLTSLNHISDIYTKGFKNCLGLYNIIVSKEEVIVRLLTYYNFIINKSTENPLEGWNHPGLHAALVLGLAFALVWLWLPRSHRGRVIALRPIIVYNTNRTDPDEVFKGVYDSNQLSGERLSMLYHNHGSTRIRGRWCRLEDGRWAWVIVDNRPWSYPEVSLGGIYGDISEPIFFTFPAPNHIVWTTLQNTYNWTVIAGVRNDGLWMTVLTPQTVRLGFQANIMGYRIIRFPMAQNWCFDNSARY